MLCQLFLDITNRFDYTESIYIYENRKNQVIGIL